MRLYIHKSTFLDFIFTPLKTNHISLHKVHNLGQQNGLSDFNHDFPNSKANLPNANSNDSNKTKMCIWQMHFCICWFIFGFLFNINFQRKRRVYLTCSKCISEGQILLQHMQNWYLQPYSKFLPRIPVMHQPKTFVSFQMQDLVHQNASICNTAFEGWKCTPLNRKLYISRFFTFVTPVWDPIRCIAKTHLQDATLEGGEMRLAHVQFAIVNSILCLNKLSQNFDFAQNATSKCIFCNVAFGNWNIKCSS